MKEDLRAKIRMVPLFGPLADCTVKHHRGALRDFIYGMLFSTATFWLTAIILMGLATNKDAGYLSLLGKTASTGQLFIFAVGMLGPIVIASAEDPENSKSFPGRLTHIVLMLIIGALASAFYAYILASREPNTANIWNMPFLIHSSVVIAGMVVVLRYLTLVYRRSTANFDTEARLKKPVEEFVAAFEERHPIPDVVDPMPTDDVADRMVDRFNRTNGGDA